MNYVRMCAESGAPDSMSECWHLVVVTPRTSGLRFCRGTSFLSNQRACVASLATQAARCCRRHNNSVVFAVLSGGLHPPAWTTTQKIERRCEMTRYILLNERHSWLIGGIRASMVHATG